MLPGMAAAALATEQAPPVLTYLASATVTSGLSSYTFSPAPVPAAGSLIVVGLSWAKESGAGATSVPTLVRFNFVAKAQILRSSDTALCGVAFYQGIMDNSGGLSVDVDWGASVPRGLTCHVWQLTGASSTTPLSSASSIAGPPSLTGVVVPGDGVVVAAAANRNTGSCTWTGPTEKADISVAASSANRASAASDAYPAGNAGLTITATFSGASEPAMAALVYR